MIRSGFKCKYNFDFDYETCLSFDCSYLPVCWNYHQVKKGMIKKNDQFMKMIGNYELFD